MFLDEKKKWGLVMLKPIVLCSFTGNHHSQYTK